MKKPKNTFIMCLDWYDSIAELEPEQKAMLLDAIYNYQINGEVTSPKDKIVKVVFAPMIRFFRSAEKDYDKRCIQNSLNQLKRWANEDGDEAKKTEIKERERYLKTHTAEEYRTLYERIPLYSHTDTESNTDIDTNSDSDNDINSVSNTEFNLNDNTKSECDSEGVQRERKEISLDELQAYCDSHGYHFDCWKMLQAKKAPLYENELASMCEFWESLVK